MEKIDDIVKPLIGILLIFSFVLTFSSCEEKSTESNQQVTVATKDTTVTEDTVSWETKIERESEKLEARYDTLKVKAKNKSKKAEEEVNQVIEKLDKEWEEISERNTSENVEATWEKFKEKAEAVIDSLDERI